VKERRLNARDIEHREVEIEWSVGAVIGTVLYVQSLVAGVEVLTSQGL